MKRQNDWWRVGGRSGPGHTAVPLARGDARGRGDDAAVCLGLIDSVLFDVWFINIFIRLFSLSVEQHECYG